MAQYRSPMKSGPTGPKSNKRGLLEDGIWLCDHNPRRPAVALTTRKENANKGRRFWACEARDKLSCGFFLWEDDAIKREKEALLAFNCLSENGIMTRVQGKDEAPPGLDLHAHRKVTGKTASNTSSGGGGGGGGATASTSRAGQRVFTGLPPPANSSSPDDSDAISIDSGDEKKQEADIKSRDTRNPTTPRAKLKRVFALGNSTSDEFDSDGLNDPDTQSQLIAMTDQSARKERQRQTQGLARSLFSTKQEDGLGGGAADNGGLPTPSTRSRNSLFVATEERQRKRQRLMGERHHGSRTRQLGAEDGGDDKDAKDVIGDISTPTPYRKTDALAPPPSEPITPSTRFTVPALTTPGSATATTSIEPRDYPKIADKIMSMLTSQIIPETTRRNIESALTQHEKLVKGVARGRNLTRAKLQECEMRVAELQERVVDLENARKMDRANWAKEASKAVLLQFGSQEDDVQ